MLKNYYFFERQVQELQAKISGGTISDVFTYKKNELILRLVNKDAFYLCIGLDNKRPYLLLKNEFNIKKPKVAVLRLLENTIIQNISIRNQERIVLINCIDIIIQIVLYGAKPYLLVQDGEQNILDTFRCRKETKPPPARQTTDISTLAKENFIKIFKEMAKENLTEIFRTHFPVFNKKMVKELLFRSDLNSQKSSNELTNDDLDKIFEQYHALLKEIKMGQPEITISDGKITTISPLHFSHLESAAEIIFKKFAVINDALLYFIQNIENSERYDLLYNECHKAIKNRMDYLNTTLDKVTEFEDLSARKALAELKGNLLLTFKQQIENGKSQVTLENIFDDKSEHVLIKLNPAKTVVENANIYFNKFKHLDKMKDASQIRKSTLQKQISDIDGHWDHLQKAKSLKHIERLRKQLTEKNVIKLQSLVKGANAPTFQHILIDERWDVYVGKNGIKNDQLTFGFAKPRDLWFHAQGVPGAHVIIRVADRNQNVPKSVIEKAAAIAAWHSKYKNESHVPVIYTTVRFVNRIRKAPPGTVKVQHDKVIFVDPLNVS